MATPRLNTGNITHDYAYFLHAKPYRDNSALTHLLTQKNGKVTFIVSGLSSKKTNKRALLQPCIPLDISYQLKPGLSKLTRLEARSPSPKIAPALATYMLYQYAHELLLTILPEQLSVDTLFNEYQQFLTTLGQSRPNAGLRIFEVVLLIHFSGLPALEKTQDSNTLIHPQNTYFFYPEHGIFGQQQPYAGITITGKHLLAFSQLVNYLANDQRHDIGETLAQKAQTLSTFLIAQLLNGRRLKTRDIYRDLKQYLREP